MLVRMELSRILIRERQHEQLIELRELEPVGEHARTLPIVIGIVEAAAIGRRLDGVEPPRPMTHDLLHNTLGALGATLDAITISDLIDGAFIATLGVTKDDGTEVEIDARPSDALALGVARDVPIYAQAHVLDRAVEPHHPDADHDF